VTETVDEEVRRGEVRLCSLSFGVRILGANLQLWNVFEVLESEAFETRQTLHNLVHC